MLTGLAGALSHLHARGIAHGSLTPENVLASAEDAHALLVGFGAATIYGHGQGLHFRAGTGSTRGFTGAGSGLNTGAGDEGDGEGDGDGEGGVDFAGMIERVEVLAFGRLVEYLLGVSAVGRPDGGEGQGRAAGGEVERGLWELRDRCVVPDVGKRPGFEEVVECLEGMMGWRGMMRIPDVVPT